MPNNKAALIAIIQQAHIDFLHSVERLSCEFINKVIDLYDIKEEIRSVVYFPKRRHIMINPSINDLMGTENEHIDLWPRQSQNPARSPAFAAPDEIVEEGSLRERPYPERTDV